MNIKDIINKKRLKGELSKDEIDYVISSFMGGEIKDYQMSALLMAITINGMNFDETLYLTDSMLRSGKILDLSSINGIVVDKHSTGGIGDKVTLILAPLLASLNIKVLKMSGRGLGYTGGTIDKLESIEGFNVNLKETDFINQVNEINLAISSAFEIDQADKKIYALRDATSTVSSIPLIASSIMSKKLASNADIIVIDVKVGNGALLENKNDALKLAQYLVDIGKYYNKKVYCVFTNMSSPLGMSVGNKLEVIESINCLKGENIKDLMEVVYSIASLIVSKVKNISLVEAFNLCYQNIENKKAYFKFLEFVKRQGGKIESLKCNAKVMKVESLYNGYITKIDALKIGKLSYLLGAGRKNKEDSIDYDVGIVLLKKIGDYVNQNDILGNIYYNDTVISPKEFLSCFEIEDKKVKDEIILGLKM